LELGCLLTEAETDPTNLLWVIPAKGVSVLNALSSIVFSIFLQYSHPLTYKIATFGIKLIPMSAGLALQLVLKKQVDVNKHPFLHEFLNKFMTACNTVFALPALSPLTSQMEKALYTYLPDLVPINDSEDTEDKAVQSYLESVWERSHRHYSTHARASRYVIHEATEIVASALRKAREYKENRSTIFADLAIRLRLFFAEFDADDVHLIRTANLYFPKENLGIMEGLSLKRAVMQTISQNDPEFERPEVRQYYTTLVDLWIGVAC